MNSKRRHILLNRVGEVPAQIFTTVFVSVFGIMLAIVLAISASLKAKCSITLLIINYWYEDILLNLCIRFTRLSFLDKGKAGYSGP